MSPSRKSNLSNHLADKFVGHAVSLQRYSAGVSNQILGILQVAEQELVDQIHGFDLEGVKREVYKRARAEAMLKQVRSIIARHYGTAHQHLQSQLLELSELEAARIVKTINKALQGSVFSTSVTRGTLRTLVSKTLIHGGPAKDWWAKQSRDLATRFATQIRLGLASGESNEQLVKRIRGQRTGRQRTVPAAGGKTKLAPVYEGGVFEGSKREARTLVHNAVQTISAKVASDVYEENSDILRGKALSVTLDNRTTVICIALSGGAWDMEGNPLPESTVRREYPGDPPYHWGCRTFPVPLTKSWDQLIDEFAGRKGKGVLDTLPNEVRASMDGEVPGTWSYKEWLENKSAEEQRDILGPGRYRLWKDGKLTLPQLVDQSNRPLTLKELEAKYG